MANWHRLVALQELVAKYPPLSASGDHAVDLNGSENSKVEKGFRWATFFRVGRCKCLSAVYFNLELY
jgi:hypothetical protein